MQYNRSEACGKEKRSMRERVSTYVWWCVVLLVEGGSARVARATRPATQPQTAANHIQNIYSERLLFWLCGGAGGGAGAARPPPGLIKISQPTRP